MSPDRLPGAADGSFSCQEEGEVDSGTGRLSMTVISSELRGSDNDELGMFGFPVSIVLQKCMTNLLKTELK